MQVWVWSGRVSLFSLWWVGSGWVHELMGWVGSSVQLKVTHVQLCDDTQRYIES